MKINLYVRSTSNKLCENTEILKSWVDNVRLNEIKWPAVLLFLKRIYKCNFLDQQNSRDS